MTALGKILIFFNLIFSCVVGFLVILDYTARTHWADGVEKRNKVIQVLQASNQAYQQENERLLAEVSKREAAAKGKVETVEAALTAAKAEISKLTADKLALQQQLTKHEAVASGSQQEVRLRQEDVEQLRTTVKKLDDENNKLVKDRNKAIEDRVAAQIERDAVKDRNERLVVQLQQLARDLERLRANVGRSDTRVATTGKNPPPETVEGLVKTVDPTGLLTITVGSDSGVTKGHTLEVFRLDRRYPDRSKYLGTIRILHSTPTQAVGQPLNRMLGTVQPGDRVASHILGS